MNKIAFLLEILFNVRAVMYDFSRNRIRIYPAFVNCTTIDWFREWPADALLKVADNYLSEISLGSEEEVMRSDMFLSGIRGGGKVMHPNNK